MSTVGTKIALKFGTEMVEWANGTMKDVKSNTLTFVLSLLGVALVSIGLNCIVECQYVGTLP